MKIRLLRILVLALLLGSLGALLVSCQTQSLSVLPANPDSDEDFKLRNAADWMMDFRLHQEGRSLSEAGKILDELSHLPSTHPAFAARLAGLRGEWHLLRGDEARARASLRTLESMGAQWEEQLYLLAYYLETDAEKKKAHLELGLENASTTGRLLLETGLASVAAGRYSEGVAQLEESWKSLEGGWQLLTQKQRDLAFELRLSLPSSPGVRRWLESPQVSLGGFLLLVREKSGVLKLLGSNTMTAREAIGEMVKKGWILKPWDEADPMTRKTAAAFFAKVVQIKENNPALATFYSDRTKRRAEAAGRTPQSPLSDVPLDSPWFDVIVTVVERGLMRLPDGKGFDPDGYVSGALVLQILDSLASLYP